MIATKQLGVYFSFIFCFAYYPSFSRQQIDTLSIDLINAEKIFLENNLTILAERLNINQADALILQAKTWPNPSISIDEVNFNRNETSEKIPSLIGNFGRDQQFTLQLEQLVLTAKKRKKNILLETSNKTLAENSFNDMLLALKIEFKSEISELIYQQHLREDLSFQNGVIEKLLKAQSSQLKLGNISRSEFLRIRALQISVNSDLNSVNNQINEKQSHLKTLMGISPTKYIKIEEDMNSTDISKLKTLSIQKLLDDANKNNTQIKLASSLRDVTINHLALEQAKRTPDITFNLNYDRAGSTMFNFFGAGITMDIPLFDRNKGNIKHATYEIQKNQMQLQETQLKVNNKIVECFQNLQYAIMLYDQIDKDYLTELQQVQAAVVENFIKKNLNLLEFLDLFNSFKESKHLYYQSLKEIQIKKYELNYLTGIEL